MKIDEVFPYLCVKDAVKAIDFYERAFGAKEKFRLTEPSGKIGHLELVFGTATLMFSDEFPDYGIHAPGAKDPVSHTMHLHVDDADAFIRRAIEAGATMVREPQDQFYGERSGTIRDPFGHQWNIGHPIEDVAVPEMQRRYDELMKNTK